MQDMSSYQLVELLNLEINLLDMPYVTDAFFHDVVEKGKRGDLGVI